MSTKICGVSEPLESAATESLKILLRQFGRNGPMSDVQQTQVAKIEEILATRQVAGVSIDSSGLHCRV